MLLKKYKKTDTNLKEKYPIMNKSTDINVLLNRVRSDKKNESRKKLAFTVAASLGLILFGVLIF
mgnify:CR=1 FL=1